MTTVPTRFKIAGYTAAEWAAENPVLLDREPAIELDTLLMKIGDGVTAWNSLPYLPGPQPNAADVGFTPAGNLSSTDAQAALEELDAEKASKVFRGALVRKASNQTAADYTVRIPIAWDQESYDTDGFHDNSTNNTRLTIPSDIAKVRLKAQVQMTGLTVDSWARLSLTKATSLDFDGVAQSNTEVGNTTVTLNLSSPVMSVSAGDYFEVTLVVETDTAIDITATRSWFSIEVVE